MKLSDRLKEKLAAPPPSPPPAMDLPSDLPDPRPPEKTPPQKKPTPVKVKVDDRIFITEINFITTRLDELTARVDTTHGLIADHIAQTHSSAHTPYSNTPMNPPVFSSAAVPTATELPRSPFFLTDDMLWARLKTRPGQLKNWLTRNHPQSEVCVRRTALSDLVNILNELLHNPPSPGGDS